MTTTNAAAISELLEAITNTRPGHTTTWEHRNTPVTVYGQRRHEMSTPTPWAHITTPDAPERSSPGNKSSTRSTRSPQTTRPPDTLPAL
ncbi:hypothetical protein DC31_05795 [Microbacterium sp. CH12i]|uniref:hypothetical protein n=1 Tax=Microbacterium sp. CH12i TaxID=1479651 RepID=UPI000460AD11|nr:hypothetical protein [Microbacterium sp. CH12i]KDA04648.1 hypothetical protein DC31_05795 [Microbacterium sp. CH12i]